jgi:hypothetical protein
VASRTGIVKDFAVSSFLVVVWDVVKSAVASIFADGVRQA